MPTALSWADPREARRAAADVRHLLWFRARTVRRPRRAALGLVVLGLVSVAAAVVPAFAEISAEWRADVRVLLPAMMSAVAFVSVATAVAGGGGRELLARDPAAVHPVSPVTDHLGALLLAPLNAGWLIQTWALLGMAAVAAGPPHLLAGQAVAVAWILAATTTGQAVAWAVEWLRRGPRGVLLARLLVGGCLGLGALVAGVPDLRGLAVAGPAGWTADAVVGGGTAQALGTALALLLSCAAIVAAGAGLAVGAARRTPRDEGRWETRTCPARPTPGSDLAMLRRIDRASIWRSVPLRRGTTLLAVAPGLVALVGGLDWLVLTLMPGLVASGCVLLFGVNIWCLDGRGLLWRESLPVAPTTVLVARAWVLVELLLAAGTTTLLLGAVRAGAPSAHELLGVVLALVVVVAQAVSAGLRWSEHHPHAVDLRSARATPAPPLAMVGYSVRLASSTTLSTMVLAGLAQAGRPGAALLTAAVLLAISALRIDRVRRRWADPVLRSRVVAVVAA